MDMLSGNPLLCQITACAQACSSTHRPKVTIRPFSSMIGMNDSGGITPAVGWRHRSSASTPTTFSLWRSNIGW